MTNLAATNLRIITGHEGFIGSALMKISGSNSIPYAQNSTCYGTLIHLAGRVGVRANQDRFIDDVFDELEMHRNVFEYAKRNKLPFFLASSSEVYGTSKTPMKESDPLLLSNSMETRWVYARIKLLNEQLAAMLHRETGRNVTIARFFNVCGPGQEPSSGMVIPRLIHAALRNEPLNIYGTGEQIRTFTHINDACYAIDRLINRTDCGFSIVNIGTENTISIEDLATRIISMTGSSSKIQKIAAPLPEIMHRIPDISKLKSIIPDWNPLPIDRIIEDTAIWMLAKMRNSDV